MKRYLFLLILAICSSGLNAQVSIDIDLNKRGISISPMLYGIFFEDINHAADGGLYAELIRNRSFEEDGPHPAGPNPENPEEAMAWNTIGQGTTLKRTTENMLNKAQNHAAILNVKTPGGGVTNGGFWGINCVAGQQYTFSIWVRAISGKPGNLTISLVSENGSTLGITMLKGKLSKHWQKMEATLIPTANDPKALFQLTMSGVGTIEMDVVSLFPPTYKGRPNGCRPQLAEMLAKMKPQFMRFPGGCYVEGQGDSTNAFHGERTIGPIEKRPGHYNANWKYWTSDGLGFHEFLQLAEDIGAKPLYVVNVGIWHGGVTPVNQLEPWIQECMDALEYANGDITTRFGRMRAENGHPQPFNIEYLEIGNENGNNRFDDNSDMSDHYFERYRLFYDAVKSKYPNIKCVGNVQAWGTDWPSWRSQEPVELVDEHYYRNPSWFADAFNKYNNYDRKGPGVYVGEYAVTSQFGKVGNMNAALGEAVYMIGMEHNSDIVKMNSYAPLFVNDNASNWPTDLIHFNSSDAFGTPSYWVQQLFSTHVGTRLINSEMEWELPEVKIQETKNPIHIGVSAWNTKATFKDPQVIIDEQIIALPAIEDWSTPFPDQNPDGPKRIRAKRKWIIKEGSVTNFGETQGNLWICPTEIAAKRYTYKVRAYKESGDEGFLMVFNYENDKDFDWFNVGGWGNAINNIEQSKDGGRINLTAGQGYKVEEGRWYDLRVEVDGDSMTTYIDDKLQLQSKHRDTSMRGVYHNVTIDEINNLIYIKVVNVGNTGTDGTINLSNGSVRTAEMVRLSSQDGQDENTKEYPFNIIPRSGKVHMENNGARLCFPVEPFSINIITAKLK